MVNKKDLDKAEVLIEVLPYIQRFNRKIIVVKYGGSAMIDEERKKDVIEDVVLLKLVGLSGIFPTGLDGNGVSRVHIMDGRIPHSLLLEIFTDKGIGTAIIKESEERYWNERQ